MRYYEELHQCSDYISLNTFNSSINCLLNNNNKNDNNNNFKQQNIKSTSFIIVAQFDRNVSTATITT